MNNRTLSELRIILIVFEIGKYNFSRGQSKDCRKKISLTLRSRSKIKTTTNYPIGRGSVACLLSRFYFVVCFSVSKTVQLTCRIPKSRISHYKSPLVFYIMHIKNRKKNRKTKSILYSFRRGFTSCTS